MTVEKKTRHERIYRFQRKLMAGVAVAVLAFTGGGLAWNSYQSTSTSATSANAQATAEFWQVIAGETTPSEPGPAARLSTTLRDLDSQEINQFRVEPADYPGVVEELGFNPFDNSGLGCTVCGPLSAETKSAIEQIHAGHTDQVVQQALNAVAPASTIPMAAVIAWSTLIYVGGSIGSIMFAVRRDSRRNGYAANTVDWRSLGSSDDEFKTKSKRLGLPYFLVVVPINKRLGKDYEAVLKKTFLFNDERELTELQNAVRSLPAGKERESLQKILYGLRDGIDEQIETYRSPQLEFQPVAASAVHDDIVHRVEEFQERLALREQAARELQGSYPQLNVVNQQHA